MQLKPMYIVLVNGENVWAAIEVIIKNKTNNRKSNQYLKFTNKKTS